MNYIEFHFYYLTIFFLSSFSSISFFFIKSNGFVILGGENTGETVGDRRDRRSIALLYFFLLGNILRGGSNEGLRFLVFRFLMKITKTRNIMNN